MAEPVHVLEVHHFERQIHGHPVIRVDHLTLPAGETLAVIGLTEAVAEVLLHHLTGRFLPDAGEIRLFGVRTADIHHEDEWFPLLRRIGLYDPRLPLMEEWPVRVTLIATFAMDWSTPLDAQCEREIAALARRVGLSAADLDRPMQLADDRIRMRIHLARAIAFRPDWLILFYPTERLAEPIRIEFGRLIRKICRDMAVLWFTRDERLAAWVCDRVVHLDPHTGTVQERFRRRRWRFRWVFK